MQTSELSFILKNSFTPDTLRVLLNNEREGDPYDAAVEAILSDDECGQRIVRVLDETSHNQQKKIGSMPVTELRKALSLEFLEKGRTLGLIVWALLRDRRISAQSMAVELANRFLRMEENDLETDAPISVAAHETPSETESEFNGDELEVDALLADMKGIDDHASDPDIGDPEDILNFTIEDDSLDEINELEWSDTEETSREERSPAQDQSGLGVISEEEITREVNELIDSLGEDVDELDEETISLEDLDEDLRDFEDSEDSDDSDWMMSEEADLPEDILSLEDVDSILTPYENLLSEEELTEPSPVMTEEEAQTQPDAIEPPTSKNGGRILLGGVMIRLQSLKDACETIFEESVELVTDEELTGDDKVVVVGKECGIHVMYCSREKNPCLPMR